MTEDLFNKKDIYFPSYSGNNDNLITLLNRATQILCEWFSKAEKMVPYSLMKILSALCLMRMVIPQKLCFLRFNLF